MVKKSDDQPGILAGGRVFLSQAFLCLLGFMSSSMFCPLGAAKEEETLRKLEVFSQVLSYVESHYVEKVDTQMLIDNAIKGMVSDLDPHSSYLMPDDYLRMTTGTSGQFGGIGVEIALRNGELTVITALDGSPADKAGLQPGDIISKVDGKSTRHWDMTEASNALRGKAGSKVLLGIVREGSLEELVMELRRELIRIRNVESSILHDHYGYIRVKNFQERTDQKVGKILRAFKALPQEKALKGLILDLRNNPGGLLEQASAMADFFVSKGVIVSTLGRPNGYQEVKVASSSATIFPKLPMIVLVNEGTASAAEIVSGALQDHERAVILGKSTFGKGSVQSIMDLEDGSALKLTIARYRTPKGTLIQKRGINPDIVVSAQNDLEADGGILREKDLPGALSNEAGKPAKKSKRSARRKERAEAVLEEGDAQLSRALEYLKIWRIFGRPGEVKAGQMKAVLAK